jgi:hypothetical protein
MRSLADTTYDEHQWHLRKESLSLLEIWVDTPVLSSKHWPLVEGSNNLKRYSYVQIPGEVKKI